MPDWNAFNRYRRNRNASGHSWRAAEDDFYCFFAGTDEPQPEKQSDERRLLLWLAERRRLLRTAP